MHLWRRTIPRLVWCGVLFGPPLQGQDSRREEMFRKYLQVAQLVTGGAVTPHWMADGNSFWYVEGAPEHTVIYKYDPVADTKAPLFDTKRLRRAIARELGHEPPHDGLPFSAFDFTDGTESAVRFSVESQIFTLDLNEYTVARVPEETRTEIRRNTVQIIRHRMWGNPVREIRSPDGRWFATERDYGIWLRSSIDGRLYPVLTDGVEKYPWRIQGWLPVPYRPMWSPNSTKLAVFKEDYRKADSIPRVQWLEQTEAVEWLRYAKAGRPMPRTELHIVDIESNTAVPIDVGWEDQYLSTIGWRPDGSEFLFLRMRRDWRKADILAADPKTGATRVILEETSETFVRGMPLGKIQATLLPDGEHLLWASERDGWLHLYVYNLDGTLVHQVTKGAWQVADVPPFTDFDPEGQWVYFTGHAEERVYDTHFYRVRLDGSGFTRLTEAIGQHRVQMSPSKQYFLDTHEYIDRAPTTELRAADGRLIRTLATANTDALAEFGWRAPEPFVVKAADGVTDLYGILFKPYDFDPNKRYPVLDYLYNGPQSTHVKWTFVRQANRQIETNAMAQLGFITFMVDGRGTTERGKAFHNVAYKNFGTHEIPDHVATLKQLARDRPYMDLDRVGIFGYSWGGYFALRGMLTAPEVYKVGIARSPVADWYDQNGYAIESFVGLPEDDPEAYARGSSLRLAKNLEGHLLMIHGTNDINAPFSATMKMARAFFDARKMHDLIIIPESAHGTPRGYYMDIYKQYFTEHLKPD